ncbi:hypothetical protein [Novosphingobium sp. AP12]|uniref:hypothetical protein n=1 Tax=Novosphingobium sp. AP12 TaxID=1144305 RepID=UPI000271DDFD|nr:hypothetical protein [Novosphingobium sp. AP12]EJL21895.1 hypothetical protein PMI02_04880 [Novosphingobium sp. AP12]
MIDAIATRRTTLNGKTYEKGDTVPMPAGQFEELKPTGRFKRGPAQNKAAPPTTAAAKATETKSSAPAD